MDVWTREYEDDQWRREGDEFGWTVEHLKASWPWRLWGIRHARCLYHSIMMQRHIEDWQKIGVGAGGASSYDLWVLYAIRRGWC